MSPDAESLETDGNAFNGVTVPDLWQQQAVTALREGRDVVVQAPTGAGKTLIFELWSKGGKPHRQAIYTVPTRALANDKLSEWRARGWDVGIATGDLAENLGAPVIVATLETQKNRLIRGDGPSLLVVDEYQMIGDRDRGLNYELAIALAPPDTQLLLLSGSVENPHHVVKWLQRIGRQAVLVRHLERPVPLEEVSANHLDVHVPSEVRGYWPRFVTKALAEDLGPILVFAPRRSATETLAGELARQLPNSNPLNLTVAQKQLVGEKLARMLRSRVAYHHSGLSYGVRAGVIEPLAKAGQLRVVVATMGLAAGINFSLRSVALAGESYRRDAVEQPLGADEILQMFGRAGRRGIDETGYVLVSANEIRLRDARPCHLARSGMVDWSALLGIMSAAPDRGRDAFGEAVRVQDRLFTTKPIPLGVEESLKHPETPCGLKTDAERARHLRRQVRQMLNSRGEWEPFPALRDVPVKDLRVMEPPGEAALNLLKLANRQAGPGDSSGENGFRPVLQPALTVPSALEKLGHGALARLPDGTWGRQQTVADVLGGQRVLLAKWVQKLTNWNGRQTTMQSWRELVVPLIDRKLAGQKLGVAEWQYPDAASGGVGPVRLLVTLGEQTLRAVVDAHGVALWRPPEREVMPPDCARCDLVPVCRQLPTGAGVAMLWRRLGLIEAAGTPTRRGRIVSFFHQGDGLAIAAALEDESLPLEEMVYELANLRGGFRFAGDKNRWDGRMAMACQRLYGLQNLPGYLESGLPPEYGAGAEDVVSDAHRNPLGKSGWVSEFVGVGDIDRVIIEWRSLLRQVAHAPDLDWPRWRELQQRAKAILRETESPTLTELPPLEHHQTKRISHRLALRRH